MNATVQYNSRKLQINLKKPIDISIPLRASEKNVRAWYVDAPKIEPVADGDWKIAVKNGACINFNQVSFNPHAHGTHTECVGHITEEVHSINKHLNQFFFLAEVITVAPERLNGDSVISEKQIKFALGNKKRDAVVIRTIPNTQEKLSAHYSHTNPTYLLEEAAIYLKEKGIKHLLIDLPSVDKEKDDCLLLAHNAFWNTSGKLRFDATITEFIYVPNHVEDGEYFLNLQIASFENDAAPSKPVLYEILS